MISRALSISWDVAVAKCGPSAVRSTDFACLTEAQEFAASMKTWFGRCLAEGELLDMGRTVATDNLRFSSVLLMIRAGRLSESSLPMTGPKSHQQILPLVAVGTGCTLIEN